MKWSVYAVWEITLGTRGMWQPKHPFVALTGHERAERSRRSGVERSFVVLAVWSFAWQLTQIASYPDASVAALRCGSWQVVQSSAPELSTKQRLRDRLGDWKR